MSFDNKYPNRKDQRKQYRGSKAFARSCRCHGSCDYCSNNIKFADKKKQRSASEEIDDFVKN